MSSIGSSTFNFDGLASGLNTSQIIDQLMTIEARPQQLMRTRMQQFQSADSAYGSLRTLLTSLRTRSSSIGSALGWERVAAASSNTDAITASGSSAAATGAVGVRVMSLASKQVLASAGEVADVDTTSVVAPGTELALTTNRNGTQVATTNVTVGGTGTLADVIAAVNTQSTVGVSATSVQVGEGRFKLQLSATNDGQTVGVDAAALGLGSWIEVSPSRPAVLRVGPDGSSYDIASTTNSFAGVLPGLTLTAREADPTRTVTVSTSRDVDGIANEVKALVDAYNAVNAEIAKQTKFDPATRQGSPLTGESAVRQLQRALADAFIGSADSTPSLAGITLGRDGTLTFDAARFKEFVARDPQAAQRLFTRGSGTPGLGARLADAVEGAVNVETGYLSTAQRVAQTTQQDLQTQIEAYQRRLDKRRLALRTQFAGLETALGQLQSQGSWLSSQIAGLNAR